MNSVFLKPFNKFLTGSNKKFTYIFQLFSRIAINNKKTKNFLFISAFPKSGSTFLFYILKNLTAYKGVRLDFHHLAEQDLYLPKLLDNKGLNTITKHHTLATKPNIQLLNRFKIQPIILIRDIFDVVISLRDYLVKTKEWNTLYVDSNFLDLNKEGQINFIIDLLIPWYIHFFVSWHEAIKMNKINARFITYEQLISNPEDTIQEILNYWGFKHINNNTIRETILKISKEREKIKMNIAIMKRGQSDLQPYQKEKIKFLAMHYKQIDFSIIGLK